MSKVKDKGRLIQIHEVPQDVHERLKDMAAFQGMSLSAFLRRELEDIAFARPLEDVLEEIRNDPPVKLSEPPEETIRKIREYGEDFEEEDSEEGL